MPRLHNSRKRIVVTGGAGFLGSHLIDRLLSDGHEVLCVDNLFTGAKQNIDHLHGHPRFEFLRHDVTFPLYVEADEIYNLACPASPVHYQHDPVQTTKTSVHGAINMLGLAKRLRCRILQASTSEVYGDPAVHPQTEAYWGNVNPVGLRSCYDEGKRCAETLFFDYHRQHGLSIKVARIFNTYGPRMHPADGRVVSNFIVQALKGEPITLYGDGSQTRSFCYVEDLIDGLVRLMESPATVIGPVNLGNPTQFSIRGLAERVLAETASASSIVFRPLPPDDPRQRQPDISLAGALLGWSPKIELSEGLKPTIAYFRLLEHGIETSTASQTALQGITAVGGANDHRAPECDAPSVASNHDSARAPSGQRVDMLEHANSAPAATTSLGLMARSEDLAPYLTSLLRPFLDQGASIRSIVALGCHLARDQDGDEATVYRVVADKAAVSAMTSHPLDGPERHELRNLAQLANELGGGSTGEDLLLVPEHRLSAIVTAGDTDFPFRAVVVLPRPPSPSRDGNEWSLRRRLFDRGLVAIGSIEIAGMMAPCFLASEAVQAPNRLVSASRGQIAMSSLGSNGRFANQLFQYGSIKFYALRHGLTAAFPDWEGRALFGLEDPFCAGPALPQLSFRSFTDDDRLLWELADPPIDVDLWGYFQEIPSCWGKHRQLLRRMFELPLRQRSLIDAWRDEWTRGGERTLVAIHVRRGDYRRAQSPWFRLVPEDIYVDWLRALWPTLRDPILFVATDEPKEIVPQFEQFELASAPIDSPLQQLPTHVRDFEILRRADYLAICNSSFSRMAAILAASGQRCFVPSFETKRFAPYEPWIDPNFWQRFAERPATRPSRRPHRRPPAVATADEATVPRVGAEPAICIEVSDLLLYLLDHPTLSGIQRVQCEILRHLVDLAGSDSIRFITLEDGEGIGAIETSALIEIIDLFRSAAESPVKMRHKVRALLHRARPCSLRPGDRFLTLGAFWAVKGMGRLLQDLKNSGVIISILIHDIIPITDPEYFEASEVRVFVKAAVEAFGFADFVLTSSSYNEATLGAYWAGKNLTRLPIHVLRLAHGFSQPPAVVSEISDAVREVTAADYVLCVGTLEARKNPTYLFNIWKMMVRSGRPHIPILVLAGRDGWLVQDFLEQLRACNHLGGKIVVLNNLSDFELDQLYRSCLLTIFPSFAEGWGLPVGESLARGKVSLCSGTTGIPEVGGELADYIDPYNASSGLQQLLQYLDDPDLRRRREHEIGSRFRPRSWRQVAEELLSVTRTLADEAKRFAAIAAMTLPPDQFLPICTSAAAIPLDGIDGSLSAELACVSGWRAPEADGAWADQTETTLRFRTPLPVGSRIHLLIRLTAPDGDCCRVRVSSGSGAETSVLVRSEADSLATLSCEVEPDNLITAQLSLMDARPTEMAAGPYWQLKGVLYFQPERLAAEAVAGNGRSLAKRLNPPERPLVREQSIVLGRAEDMDQTPRVDSLADFAGASDCYWQDYSAGKSYCKAPIVADVADRQTFYLRYHESPFARRSDAAETIKLTRRSNQYVSLSRFSEGAVFDRSGVHWGFGFIQNAPSESSWISAHPDGIAVSRAALAACPYYDSSCLIFYNGNLHNYYHWLAEALLSLDVLTSQLEDTAGLSLILPKSMDINALIDHRGSLRALGFDKIEAKEVAAPLIKVSEAIWLQSGIVEEIPAPHLKRFRQRLAAKYAGAGGKRNRRLLIERKGPTRKIRNFGQVQAFLSSKGFETIALEGMSVLDQILLFQRAEFVVGAHGAGLANLLFCEAGTRVIEFMPSAELRPFFWLISEKLELLHGMQFCATHDSGFQGILDVDIDKLQALYGLLEPECHATSQRGDRVPLRVASSVRTSFSERS